MGLLEVLTVVFVILKLLGVISWSWWIVLSPIIGSFLVYVVVFIMSATFHGKLTRSINKDFKNKGR